MQKMRKTKKNQCLRHHNVDRLRLILFLSLFPFPVPAEFFFSPLTLARFHHPPLYDVMATQCFSPRLIRLKPFWLFLYSDCYTTTTATTPSAYTAQNHPLDHRLEIIVLGPRCVCLSTQLPILYRFFIVVASAYTFTLASY